MASYRLFIKPSAAKEIEALPTAKIRREIVRRIESLADEPRPHGCTKLSGAAKYRLGHGRYRIVYTVKDDRLIVVVVRMAHRKDAYR